MAFTDPFGLCPDGTGSDGKQTTTVSDCPDTNLGNAWRALDETGKEGQRVIQGVVDKGMGVTTGRVNDANCTSKHACYDPVSNAITLNGVDPAGAMAVGIAHEYHHSTLRRATTAGQWARNELSAWDAGEKIYSRLSTTYRQQAENVYGAAYTFLGTPDGRAAVLRQWTELAKVKWGVPF